MEQIYKERLLALADVVERSESFGMSAVFWGKYRNPNNHPCGTPACILGHAEAMRLDVGIVDEVEAYGPGGNSWMLACKWLGLNEAQANELFMPINSEWYEDDDEFEECNPNRINQAVHWEQSDPISGEHAARVIRAFVSADGKELPKW